jgi:hypothetical protein
MTEDLAHHSTANAPPRPAPPLDLAVVALEPVGVRREAAHRGGRRQGVKHLQHIRAVCSQRAILLANKTQRVGCGVQAGAGGRAGWLQSARMVWGHNGMHILHGQTRAQTNEEQRHRRPFHPAAQPAGHQRSGSCRPEATSGWASCRSAIVDGGCVLLLMVTGVCSVIHEYAHQSVHDAQARNTKTQSGPAHGLTSAMHLSGGQQGRPALEMLAAVNAGPATCTTANKERP